MKAIWGFILASVLGIAFYALMAVGVGGAILSPAPALAQGCGETWHTPGAHGVYGPHEHGASPQAWVAASAWPAFAQCAEFHTGYKGVRATSANGVEAYFIAHIFSTTFARSHGNHDYQLWVKEPTGAVSHWGLAGGVGQTSQLNFGVPTASHDCGKSPNRPSMQQEPNGPSEAWYTGAEQASQVPSDIGWLMRDPNEAFCPGVITGDGTRRDIGFTVNASNFATALYAQYISPTLASYGVFDPNNPDKGTPIRFGSPLQDYSGAPMSVPN